MYDQADVSCLVENEEGENVASTNLNVNYAPTILLHPRFVLVKILVTVTKCCEHQYGCQLQPTILLHTGLVLVKILVTVRKCSKHQFGCQLRTNNSAASKEKYLVTI